MWPFSLLVRPPHSVDETERSRIGEAVLVPRGVQQPFAEAEKKKDKKEAIDFFSSSPKGSNRAAAAAKGRDDSIESVAAMAVPSRVLFVSIRTSLGAPCRVPTKGVVGRAPKGQAARRTTGVCNGSPEKRHELFLPLLRLFEPSKISCSIHQRCPRCGTIRDISRSRKPT